MFVSNINIIWGAILNVIGLTVCIKNLSYLVTNHIIIQDVFYLLFTNSFYRNQKHKHGQIVEIFSTLNSEFGISEFETLKRHQQQTLTAQNNLQYIFNYSY